MFVKSFQVGRGRNALSDLGEVAQFPPSVAVQIDGRGSEPGLVVLGPQEPVSRARRPDERLLNHILGLTDVTDDAVQLHDQPAVRTTEHLAQRRTCRRRALPRLQGQDVLVHAISSAGNRG